MPRVPSQNGGVRGMGPLGPDAEGRRGLSSSRRILWLYGELSRAPPGGTGIPRLTDEG
jgi:hypothetical protein